MGDVVKWPRHARTSSASLKPKTERSTDCSRFAKASEKTKKYSEGMKPRAIQLLTAGDFSPTSSAALAVPPTASTAPSTDVIMQLNSSRSVKMSSLHAMALVTPCELLPNNGMARTLKDVAERLSVTLKALEISPAEACRRTGIKPNAMSQFLSHESGRRITIAAAYRLRDEFRLTLDWIYDGDPSGLPDRLAQKLRKAKAA